MKSRCPRPLDDGGIASRAAKVSGARAQLSITASGREPTDAAICLRLFPQKNIALRIRFTEVAARWCRDRLGARTRRGIEGRTGRPALRGVWLLPRLRFEHKWHVSATSRKRHTGHAPRRFELLWLDPPRRVEFWFPQHSRPTIGPPNRLSQTPSNHEAFSTVFAVNASLSGQQGEPAYQTCPGC